nr:4713_t:CDS:1 [Entrophospora candida]
MTEERHGLEPSALTIDYLRRSHENGSLYSKSTKHNTIDFKAPVLMPDGSNKQITKESKEVYFYYPNDEMNHMTGLEDTYYDDKGNHIKTHIHSMHISGVTENGKPVKFGLGKSVRGKELDNKDIENFARVRNIKNGDNFVSLASSLNNMERNSKNGHKHGADNIKPYNYNKYNKKSNNK